MVVATAYAGIARSNQLTLPVRQPGMRSRRRDIRFKNKRLVPRLNRPGRIKKWPIPLTITIELVRYKLVLLPGRMLCYGRILWYDVQPVKPEWQQALNHNKIYTPQA